MTTRKSDCYVILLSLCNCNSIRKRLETRAVTITTLHMHSPSWATDKTPMIRSGEVLASNGNFLCKSLKSGKKSHYTSYDGW